MTTELKFYLTINDQETVDFCHFRTFFEYTTTFCDTFWAGSPPVEVPDFVKQTYPQFITMPMTYEKRDTTSYLFLDSKCGKLWEEGEKLSF